MNPLVQACAAALILIVPYLYFQYERPRKLSRLSQQFGCKPVFHLPNSWLLPLGLDKLKLSLEAETRRRFPVLCFEEHEKHGDTYAQSAGGLYIIITRDPRNLRAVLSEKFKEFGYGSIRHGCFASLLGNGILNNEGADWERSRRALAPIFHRPNPLPTFDVLETHAQTLIRAIRSAGSAATDGQVVVDLQPPLREFSLKAAAETLLGVSLQSGVMQDSISQDFDDFTEAFSEAVKYTSRREKLKAFYWLLNSKSYRASCDTARAALRRIITRLPKANHEKGSPAGKPTTPYQDIAQNLREDEKIGDEILNLLFAARDTTSSLTNWVFYILAREPKVFEEVRAQIVLFLGNDAAAIPTDEQLSKLTFLDHILYETLRLFPPVPINGRISTADTTLPHGGGPDGESPILIPKDTFISYSPYAVQRSTKLYGDDANEFRPSRWKDRTFGQRTVDWSLMPFNGGPRKCLGERYALRQVKYVTCRLLQSFEGLGIARTERERLERFGSYHDAIKYQVALTMEPYDGNWVAAELAV